MSALAHRTQRLTVVLLVASVSLIVPGLGGLGASFPLAVGLAAVAGLLFAARDELAAATRRRRLSLGSYFRELWVGPLVAAVVALAMLGASPGEVQALGGLCGLVGMLNYFLRPIYAALVGLGRYVGRTLG